MVEWLVHRPWRGRLGFKPAGECYENYCPKKNKSISNKIYVFRIVFLSQPVLLCLHLSLPGMSFAHCPSFEPLRSLSVASRLSLVSLPARPLSVASRQFLALAPFLVPSWHCRLPADFLWLRPRYCAIQPTVGCQPTLLRWGSNPCLYRNLVRNQRVSSH